MLGQARALALRDLAARDVLLGVPARSIAVARLGPNGLEIETETTRFIVRWTVADGVKASLHNGTPRSHIHDVASGHNPSTRGSTSIRSLGRHKRDKFGSTVLSRFARIPSYLRLLWNRGAHDRRYRTDGQQAVQLVVEQSLAVLGRLRLRRLGRLLFGGLLWWGRRRRGLHFCVRLVRGGRRPGQPMLCSGRGVLGTAAAGRRLVGGRGARRPLCLRRPCLQIWMAIELVRSGAARDGSAESCLRLLRLAWFVAAGEAAPLPRAARRGRALH